MDNTISTSTIIVEREVVADISVLQDHLNFASNSVAVENQTARIVIRAYQTAFEPFRIYQISFGIPHGLEAKTYPLGTTENGILAHYLPPNTSPLNSYNAISGSITFYEAPSPTRIRGKFHFKGQKFDEAHPEIADIRNGTLEIEVDQTK